MKKKSSFSTNVLTLTVGTIIAQIIIILSGPVLTRLYGPEAFGISAMFGSLASIINVISNLRYELSIVLPETDDEAANLVGASLLILGVITTLTAIFVWFGGDLLVHLLNVPALGPYLWLLPITVLIGGIFLTLSYWNTRTRQFKRLTYAQISNSLSYRGTSVTAGLLGFTSGGYLIGGYIIGQTFSMFVLGFQIWREHWKFFRDTVRWQSIKSAMIRYKKFPLIDTWSSLLNTLSWQLPTLLLGSFFSPIVVGFYAIGFTLLHMPMSLVGKSIGQVFYKRAVDAKMEGNLHFIVEKVFKVLLQIASYPMFIIAIIGVDFFIVVFGKAWGEAGLYAQILSIWALVWFISSPLSTIYYVFEKQKFGLIYNIANFITRLASLVIGYYFNSVILALVLFSVSGIFVYGYLCYQMLAYTQVNWHTIRETIIRNLILFLPAGILLSVLKLLNVDSIYLVAVASVAAIIYYFYLVMKDQEIKQLVMQFDIVKKCVKYVKW